MFYSYDGKAMFLINFKESSSEHGRGIEGSMGKANDSLPPKPDSQPTECDNGNLVEVGFFTGKET